MLLWFIEFSRTLGEIRDKCRTKISKIQTILNYFLSNKILVSSSEKHIYLPPNSFDNNKFRYPTCRVCQPWTERANWTNWSMKLTLIDHPKRQHCGGEQPRIIQRCVYEFIFIFSIISFDTNKCALNLRTYLRCVISFDPPASVYINFIEFVLCTRILKIYVLANRFLFYNRIWALYYFTFGYL